MKPRELAAAAKAAPPKVDLEEYREAVEALRQKGYSWREVADFLSERGVVTDHTRVYRLFGGSTKKRRKESRPIEISSITFVGEKPSKRGRSWSVLEIEIPSKLGAPITVEGYVWGTGRPSLGVEEGDPVAFRDALLVIRSGRRGFPLAHIEADLQAQDDRWTHHDIYVVPKWETLL